MSESMQAATAMAAFYNKENQTTHAPDKGTPGYLWCSFRSDITEHVT